MCQYYFDIFQIYTDIILILFWYYSDIILILFWYEYIALILFWYTILTFSEIVLIVFDHELSKFNLIAKNIPQFVLATDDQTKKKHETEIFFFAHRKFEFILCIQTIWKIFFVVGGVVVVVQWNFVLKHTYIHTFRITTVNRADTYTTLNSE